MEREFNYTMTWNVMTCNLHVQKSTDLQRLLNVCWKKIIKENINLIDLNTQRILDIIIAKQDIRLFIQTQVVMLLSKGIFKMRKLVINRHNYHWKYNLKHYMECKRYRNKRVDRYQNYLCIFNGILLLNFVVHVSRRFGGTCKSFKSV